jgi:hypothetical protein
VTVETKSDMFGYFEFRICPYNDDQSVTKECLNKNILEIGDTGYTRYKVWYQGYHVIPLQLPADLKCDKCLLQFHYHTGKKKHTINRFVSLLSPIYFVSQGIIFSNVIAT